MLTLFLSLISVITLASTNIKLTEGNRINLRATGPIWIENGDIVTANSAGKDFNILGLKPGSSELRIGKLEFRIDVISRIQNRTYNKFSTIIDKSISLRLNQENQKVRVEGRLMQLSEWQMLAEACDHENCDYEMRASMSDNLKKQAQHTFSKILKLDSIYPFKLEFSDKIQIHISKKYNQLDKLTKITKKFGITLVQDENAIDLQPLVKINITVAEIKKDVSLKYGVQWPTTYSAQLLPKLQGTNESIELALHAREGNGWGKILASPNLLCRSGTQAEFVAGGEFPIKIINQKLQDVIWKKYGILLKVKPLADFSGRMRISLETEVSSLDLDRTVDGVPGLFTNRVQSHFDLTEPRTIALSGLLKSETGEKSEGLPGLGKLPVLGPLFSSRDFHENRSELVIFVRPEIIETENYND